MEQVTKTRTVDADSPWSVAVLDWPEQADEAEALRQAGRLRLLLVAPDAPPPVDWDLSSDWLRRPAEPRDILARVETMQRRMDAHHADLRLDADGLLWRGRRWVALAPVETRIVEALLKEPSRVLSRAELEAAVWPGQIVRARALDTRLKRLRGRVAELGVQIVNVRQRGFFLARSDEEASRIS